MGGLGEKAKTFIHSIDSLDADKGQISSMAPLAVYGPMQTWKALSSAANTAYIDFKNPSANPIRLYSVSMSNNNRQANPGMTYWITNTVADAIPLGLAPAPIATTITYISALPPMGDCLTLDPGHKLRVSDYAYQNGDTITVNVLFREVLG